MIIEVIGDIKEISGNKYLVFGSSDKNKELFKKIQRPLRWD